MKQGESHDAMALTFGSAGRVRSKSEFQSTAWRSMEWFRRIPSTYWMTRRACPWHCNRQRDALTFPKAAREKRKRRKNNKKRKQQLPTVQTINKKQRTSRTRKTTVTNCPKIKSVRCCQRWWLRMPYNPSQIPADYQTSMLVCFPWS